MANELKYGDQIHLQNGYDDFKGGYLDTLNNHTTAGLKHYVATADSTTRDKGTGTWEIVSASGKAAGQPVLSGDLVHLRNLYAGDGGYLDAVNHATTAQKGGGGKYGVATAQSKDRTPGSGRWRIFAQTSTSFDQSVRAGDVVHLWNTYDDNGGFLETNQNAAGDTKGGKLDVCTNAYYNRGDNVADWKIHKA
ncbi:hypothetical protein [Streptomyces canus]|uniref:hypothetical protein n=1 Tax=Streptomyces canus TaxID=58343 RepID=UPI002DDBCE0B|nr:hypothetical protein [Streptomyces canus]WSD82843.1 hypothetical protein OG925_00040 [Streptomyces canus]WSD91991.1 hypothetical protein OG925_50440 [Streptomyces canus]WSD92518.1 hypothetical protein OG925_50515 [Streptomyces canus]